MERFWGVVGMIVLLWIGPEAVANDYLYQYLEAEAYTSTTANIRVFDASQLKMTNREQIDAEWFIKRSGLDKDYCMDVSQSRFIQAMTDSGIMDKIAYDFTIPVDGNYYIYLRTNSPPPCLRRFSIWVDRPAPKSEEIFNQLYFAFWNLWSWWPWGDSHDNGIAKPYQLTKGKHTLYIGHMNKDLKIDKLLITNDPKYRPFGISQEYYSSSFEPSTIIDVHAIVRQNNQLAEAVGWGCSPKDHWKIGFENLNQNHYLLATNAANAGAPMVALIEKISYATYDANLRFNLAPTTHTSDILVYLSYRSPEDVEYLKFENAQMTYVKKQNGAMIMEQAIRMEPVKTGVWHALDMHRRRTSLSVDLDEKRIVTFDLAMPRPGRFGVGCERGGVGFDDVSVKPSDDPDASFEFASMNAEFKKDWDLVRSDQATTWTATMPLCKGDLLVLRAPAWSNSQLEMEMDSSTVVDFSLFFPFQSMSRNVELKFQGGSGSLNVVYTKRLDGREEKRDLARHPFDPKRDKVRIQSINGLYSIFLNDEKLFDCNEYDLVAGTLALRQGGDAKALPVQKLSVTRKDLIYDSFPISRNAELNPAWTVKDGSWKVSAVMDGAGTQGDGQLTTRVPGTIFLGKEQEPWLSTTMQISADFSLEPDFALLGWVDLNGWLELHCCKGKVEIRKMQDGSPITLAECAVPNLKEGWHKIDFFLGKKNVSGKIDGQQVLSIPINGMKGRSGIKNYGSYAAFDNLILQVLEIENRYSGLIKPVDTGVADIGRDVFDKIKKVKQ